MAGGTDREQELADLGRGIIDANLYMVLGTADSAGTPWAAPVYYAHRDYREFLWVSRAWRQHSENIAVRPEISIVIFDSSVPINTGQGVYMTATARLLAGDERNDALDIYSLRAVDHGGERWTLGHVEPPAEIRLYGATANEQWVLDPGTDNRVSIRL